MTLYDKRIMNLASNSQSYTYAYTPIILKGDTLVALYIDRIYIVTGITELSYIVSKSSLIYKNKIIPL